MVNRNYTTTKKFPVNTRKVDKIEKQIKTKPSYENVKIAKVEDITKDKAPLSYVETKDRDLTPAEKAKDFVKLHGMIIDHDKEVIKGAKEDEDNLTSGLAKGVATIGSLFGLPWYPSYLAARPLVRPAAKWVGKGLAREMEPSDPRLPKRDGGFVKKVIEYVPSVAAGAAMAAGMYMKRKANNRVIDTSVANPWQGGIRRN
jgi:hypothetical protein